MSVSEPHRVICGFAVAVPLVAGPATLRATVAEQPAATAIGNGWSVYF